MEWMESSERISGRTAFAESASGSSTALMIFSSDKEKSDNAANIYPSPKSKLCPCQTMHGLLQSLMLAFHDETPWSHRSRMQPRRTISACLMI